MKPITKPIISMIFGHSWVFKTSMMTRNNAQRLESAATGPAGPLENAVEIDVIPIQSKKLPKRPTLNKYMSNAYTFCQYQLAAIIRLIAHTTPHVENVRVVESNFILSPERCFTKMTWVAKKQGVNTPNKTGIQGFTSGSFKSYLNGVLLFIPAKLMQRADTTKLKTPII